MTLNVFFRRQQAKDSALLYLHYSFKHPKEKLAIGESFYVWINNKFQAEKEYRLASSIGCVENVIILSALIHSIFSTRTALYELARQFAALSLHTLRKQKNINDRVVIAMTEKFTLVQLSSESIGYRHDATQ